MNKGQGTDIGSLLQTTLASLENLAAPAAGVEEEPNLTGTELDAVGDKVQNALVEENPSATGVEVLASDSIDSYAAGAAMADTLSSLANQAEAAADSPAAAVGLESIQFALTATMNSHRIDYQMPAFESGQSPKEKLGQIAFALRSQAQSIRQQLVASMEAEAKAQADLYYRYEDSAVKDVEKLKKAIGVIKANRQKLLETPVSFDHKTILAWLSYDKKPVTDFTAAISREISNIGKLTPAIKAAHEIIRPMITELTKSAPSVPNTLKALEHLLEGDIRSIITPLENLKFLFNVTMVTETVKGTRGDSYLIIVDRWEGKTTDGGKAPLSKRLKASLIPVAIAGLGATGFFTGAALAGAFMVGIGALMGKSHADEINKGHIGGKTKSVIEPDTFVKALEDLERLVPIMVANGRIVANAIDNSSAVSSSIGRFFSIIREHNDEEASKKILEMVNKHNKGERIVTLSEAKDYIMDRWYYAYGTVRNVGNFAQIQILDNVHAGSRCADKMVDAIAGKK